MKINKHIFRSYDIRGIAMGDNLDISEEVALHIGKATGTYFVRLGRKNLCCGRDGRLTGEALQKAFIQGVLSTGLNVFNINLASSPMLYYAVSLDDYDCGVNVTASHNPKEYNGFKIVDDWAHSVCGDQIQEIYNLTQTQEYEVGEGILKDADLLDLYINDLKSKVKIERPLKIVVDSGNGITGLFVDKLFDIEGIELHTLYTEVDGDFPNHIANPEKEENLQDLAKKVVELKADLGIGFDGDGDRVGLLDENGRHYSCDLLLMLLARDALSRNPGRKVVFDMKSSKVVENDIRDHGGIPLRTKTGHSHIEEAIKDVDAIIGGEISGHMFFAENYFGFDDAFLAALKLIEILSQSDHTFSEFFKDLPHFFNTPEIRISCPDDKKFGLIHDATEAFQSKGLKVLTVDGAFIEVDENSWGAVRASNTAPELTMRFESDKKDKLDEIIELFIEVLSRFDYIDLAEVRKLLND
jgi:phosphomannomutase/phosphoglucomutase